LKENHFLFSRLRLSAAASSFPVFGLFVVVNGVARTLTSADLDLRITSKTRFLGQ